MHRNVWLRLLTVITGGLSLLGCQGMGAVRRSVPAEYGEVLIYVDPLPREASRLRFSLLEAWALREDGATVPLALSWTDLDGSSAQRQRLLAHDALPPGRYRGVALRSGKATLKGEQGLSALLVGDAPAEVDAPFTVDRDRPATLFWYFRPGESVQQGFRFSPVFSRYTPEDPTPAVLGYVCAPESRHLTLFDKKAGRVVGAVGTGAGARSMAVDTLNRRAYVALADEDAVDVLDLASNQMLRRIRLPLRDSPWDVRLLSDRRTLLLVNRGSDSVSFVDATTGGETARLNVGRGPTAVVVDRTGRRAYVLNTASDAISVLDLANRSVTATFSTEVGPAAAEVSRRNDKLFVGHAGSPYLLVLDSVSGAVLKRILVGGRVSALRVDPRTDYLYVGESGDGDIAVYDPFTLLPSDHLRAAGGPERLVLDADERQLYALQPRERLVTALGLGSHRVSFELDVGAEPAWLSVTGEP